MDFLSASFTAADRAMMRKQGKAGNRFAPSLCAARGLDPRGSNPRAACRCPENRRIASFPRGSVERSVLAGEAPPAVDEGGGDVVIGVARRIPGRAVADLEVDDILIRLIDQMMRIAGCRLEACAHAGFQRR